MYTKVRYKLRYMTMKSLCGFEGPGISQPSYMYVGMHAKVVHQPQKALRIKTDRQTDRQTERQTDRQTDGQTDRQTDRQR
jgi:hypothetical protein